MGLHPSVAAVRRAVRESLADLPDDAVVVVACSGGPDSLALAAATVAEARGRRVVGATVDHGLQEGSAAQAARVVEQLAALGADETLTARVQVEAGGLGPEAAARRARYAVLEQVATHTGASAVLLGHTRDDQAETVLLGLARGSGGRSLAGMRRAFDVYRRPFLDLPRADTVTACQVWGLDAWEDPHNADPGYARVRVRRRVLPVLEEEIGPGIAAALARTAEQLRTDADLLDDLADAAWAELASPAPGSTLAPTLGAEALAALHPALRRRLLRRLALEAGSPAAELFHEHVLAMERLVTHWHGQRWIDLPGPLRAVRRDGIVRVERPA
ncbi:tRNA lysidine(34) synthetase TilS [Nocardioides sp. GY 10127]|uniref:tRNA lysidine(34) synthetase TilS n=1 Tax=Nocardioides sp. GY 10127 TaxID=2569762 RepID=UPI0010A75113|nr:tRNA lysidine(34) synthetase TilS [Nocardioides sp. GY 10127]TIC79383.1 tRNA lysidine(34) synthetase TilS [Nocardioides sp. GY 10127]